MSEQTSAFNAVNQFLRTQQPLLLIIGKEGCGKTLLLNEIIAQTHISRNVIRMKGSNDIHPSQIVKMLTKHWAAKVENSKAGLDQQLQEVLTSLAKNEQRCSLIIDDAHQLPLSVMAALSHLAIVQENNDTVINIVLSGRSDLHDKMQNLQVKPIPYLDLENKEIPEFKIENHEPQPIQVKPINLLLKHKIKIGAVITLGILSVVMTWFYQPPHTVPLTTEVAANTSISAHIAPQNSVALTEKDLAKSPLAVAYGSVMSTRPSKVAASLHTKHYIIQILSGDNRQGLVDFIHQHHLGNQAKIIESTYHHKPWFLLSYGEYDSVSDAHQDMNKFPAAVKSLHPWVRPESTIKPYQQLPLKRELPQKAGGS